MQITLGKRFRLGVVAALALVALALTATAGAAEKPKPKKGSSAAAQYRPASKKTVTVTTGVRRVGACKVNATRRAVAERKKCKTRQCVLRSRRSETVARKNCESLLKK